MIRLLEDTTRSQVAVKIKPALDASVDRETNPPRSMRSVKALRTLVRFPKNHLTTTTGASNQPVLKMWEMAASTTMTPSSEHDGRL